MLKGLGLWEDWGTAQSEKLVPYSLRGFFITMSLGTVLMPKSSPIA